ncbi:glycosyl transferase family 90 [Paracoccus aminophilus]|nr:glycosyl transferase family 90 [Paracoccus aminophilus]
MNSIPAHISVNGCGFAACSGMLTEVDLDLGTVRNRARQLRPVRRRGDGSFVVGGPEHKIHRTAGVANELSLYAKTGKFLVDMEDGRRVGATGGKPIGGPIISYCRRKGAENVFLWPLPEYHSIGAEHYPGLNYSDNVSFQNKADQIVWRGALSGHCSDVEHDVFEDPTRKVIERHEVGDLNASEALALLRKNTRFRLVERYLDHPDFNINLVPTDKVKKFLNQIGLSNFASPARAHGFFTRYKYIASLRGNDTGSNFLEMANTNSAVMKEEDGWELFYSYLFKPWVHYIPLVSGAHDVVEKLNWARQNEWKVEEISRRARASCCVLKDRLVREIYLKKVSRRYLEATGQVQRDTDELAVAYKDGNELAMQAALILPEAVRHGYDGFARALRSSLRLEQPQDE